MHIALDTIVLYGVLRERNIDERGGDNITREAGPGSSNLSSGRPMPAGSGVPGDKGRPTVTTTAMMA